MLVSILAFVFALGLIILIHEGGHFLFARRVNVLCREYSFGMGPQLFKKKVGETTYSIRALPIGGFCAIAGEEVEADPLKDLEFIRLGIEDGIVKKFYLDDTFTEAPKYRHIAHDTYDEANTGNLWIKVMPLDSDEEIEFKVDPKALYVTKKEEVQIAPFNRCLASKRKRDRALIMFGGPLMNFILAIVVFFFAGLINGYPNMNSSVIDSVSSMSTAELAGIEANDEIKSFTVDGVEYVINSWSDIEEFMNEYSVTSTFLSNVITCKLNREGQTLEVELSPELTVYSLGGLQFCQRDGKVLFDSNTFASAEDRTSYAESIIKMYGEDSLPLGSEITAINGKTVNSLQDLYNEFSANEKGEAITLTTSEEKEYIFAKPYSLRLLNTQKSLGSEGIPLAKISIGISPTYKFGFFKSFAYSIKRTFQSMSAITDTLAMLFSGKIGAKNLGGIVSIFTYTSSAAKQGFSTLLNWVGFLSVNIGIMNLLPIPALDGGRLVFVAYEAITKKKPSPKVETILITVTMILLFGLMAYVTFNDIMRLF